jgi:hypothetical protein
VFTNLDEVFFESLAAAELPEPRLREVHLHAFSNRGCYVPELGLIYLPYFSVHHAAEEAMHLLHHRTSGFDPVTGDAHADFYARILWIAVGYAASKLVNPKRRSPGEQAFRAFLRIASRELHEPDLAFRKLVARFVVQHKDHERARRDAGRGRLQQVFAQELDVTLEVVQALGGILGEQLFAALRDGRMGRDGLRAIVATPRGDDPSETYFALLDSISIGR